MVYFSLNSNSIVPEFIEELKDKIPIEDILADDGIELKRKGKELVGYHSNKHDSDSKTSLSVNPSNGLYYCFNCGEGGDVIRWLELNRNMTFMEAIRHLAGRAGISMPDMDPEQQKEYERRRKERQSLEAIYTAAAQFFHQRMNDELIAYCREKWGLTEETLEKYLIGFAPSGNNPLRTEGGALKSHLKKQFDDDLLKKSGLFIKVKNKGFVDFFHGRLVFPYWKNGQVVYFIARSTEHTPDVPWEKYKNGDFIKYKKLLTHSEKHSYVSTAVENKYLAGEDTARGAEELIITEGIADCYAAIQAGFGCVSPVTTQFRKNDFPKLARIARRAKNVYIINDNEENKAGEKGAWATAEYLEEQGCDVRLVELPRPKGVDKVDLADYLREHDPDDLRKLLTEAKRPIDIMLNELETTPEDQEKQQEIINKIARLDDRKGQDIYINKLHKVVKDVGINKSTLKKDLTDAIKVVTTAEIEAETENNEQQSGAYPYHEKDGATFMWQPTKQGPVPVQLSNFTARITREEVRDDGAEAKTFFTIKGSLPTGEPLSPAEVQAERFPAMNWVTKNWGNRAVVLAGFGTKDHLRTAVQLLSGDVPRIVVYTHTGWRYIDGRWLYLHAGGAIGPDGPVPDIHTDLGDKMGNYESPDPPSGIELQRAIKASLSIIRLAPERVIIPGLSAVYRAPLGEADPVDFSGHFSGPTGTQKTELAAILQAHYGPRFSGRNLPGNWSSTANSLEKQAFLLKDAFFVVDDFAPGGSMYEINRLHRDADRLLRGAGNQSGRKRMRPDGTLRPEYQPRGLIVSTGEDIPRGQSLRARLFIVEVSPGDVDLERLTVAQREAADGLFAQAMAGYIRWLAPQIDKLKDDLPARQIELREKARSYGVVHDRTPENQASLALGWEVFLKFAQEAGAITSIEYDEFWSVGWDALIEAAQKQADFQVSEEPTQRFLELLAAAIVSGGAHLADYENGAAPEDAELWGWNKKPSSDSYSSDEWIPSGDRTGWIEEDSIYLEPDSAFRVVKKFSSDQGDTLSITKRTLWKRMSEKGLLASADTGRNTVRKYIQGNRRRVIHLYMSLMLQKRSHRSHRSPAPDEPRIGGDLGSEKRDRLFESPKKTVHKTGPHDADAYDRGAV